jgi:hypothetical protein
MNLGPAGFEGAIYAYVEKRLGYILDWYEIAHLLAGRHGVVNAGERGGAKRRPKPFRTFAFAEYMEWSQHSQ